MFNRKSFFISTALLLTPAVLFFSLFMRQRHIMAHAGVVHLSGAYAYITTQLMHVPEDISEQEWNWKSSYLHIIGNQVLPSADTGYSEISEIIMLFGYIPNSARRAAIELLQSIKVNFNTEQNCVNVLEGDAGAVIAGLKLLSGVQ